MKRFRMLCTGILVAVLGLGLPAFQTVWAQEDQQPTGQLFQKYLNQSREEPAEAASEELPEPPPSNPAVGEFFRQMLGGEEAATQEATSEEMATEEAATEANATEEAATEETTSEEAATEEAATEETASEANATEEAATEETATEEAATEEAAMTPEATLEEDIQQLFGALSLFGTPQYAEMVVEPDQARISGITIMVADMQDSIITIDQIVLSDYAYLGDVLKAARMEMSGITIPVTPNFMGESAQDLQDMGYQKIVADLIVGFHYNEADNTFTLDELSLNLHDMGALALTFTLGNIDLAQAMQVNPDDLQIVRAEMSYQDASLMPRLLEMVAREEGMTLDQLIQEATTEADMEIERVRAEGDEFTASAYEQLKLFLQAPNMLRLTMEPPAPVSFASLDAIEGTDDAVEVLNMVVVAE